MECKQLLRALVVLAIALTTAQRQREALRTDREAVKGVLDLYVERKCIPPERLPVFMSGIRRVGALIPVAPLEAREQLEQLKDELEDLCPTR